MQQLLQPLVFLFLTHFLSAQSALESLVSAEKSFAKLSAETSTKNAFIHFLGDSSIIFRPTPVLGKVFWEAAEEGTDLLTWEPLFADVSAAGDLGYTTGPFEYRGDRSDEKPAGTGHFVSVWKKEKDGIWKVALDLGNSHPPAPKTDFATSAIVPKVVVKSVNAVGELMQTEQAFCNQQNKNGLSAYSGYLSAEARLYRPSVAPYDNKAAIQELLAETDKQFSFTPDRADVADSGDLGYVYGGGTVAITQGEEVKTMNINYLRIWKKEDGSHWSIVLDLVGILRR